jgi:hypothetical protein
MSQEIQDSDYNAIRKKIVAVMGPGGFNPANDLPDAKFGYGQDIVSSDVERGQLITAAQWNALRFDILNARIHQTGATPTINPASTGQTVKIDEGPLVDFNNQANIAAANKFDIGIGQFVIDSGTSVSRTTSWKVSVSTTLTVTFGSVDYARWFFNSGSRLRIYATRSGGAATSQNTEWTNLLNAVGVFEFGADTSPVGFYSLTNTNQICRTQAATSPYSANRYTINARSNVANNSNGGATQVIFTISWVDGYIDRDVLAGRPGTFNPPDDVVDGTLEVTIEEQRASGVLLPSGTSPFIIVSPTYSATAISGS